jgi:hypothetical protein
MLGLLSYESRDRLIASLSDEQCLKLFELTACACPSDPRPRPPAPASGMAENKNDRGASDAYGHTT